MKILTFCTGVLHLIQINHQPDATLFQSIILTFVYNSTCFGRFPAHHQELNNCSDSLWFYLRIVVTVVLCSWSGRPAGRHWVTDFIVRIIVVRPALFSTTFSWNTFLSDSYLANYATSDHKKLCWRLFKIYANFVRLLII
jgi:hypothetical protein